MSAKQLKQLPWQLAQAVFMLCFMQCAIAQQPSTDAASPRQAVAATAKPVAAAASATEAAPQVAQPPANVSDPGAAATPSCPVCPEQQALNQTLTKLEAATSAAQIAAQTLAQASASAAAKQDDSFWGSVFVNVFSSRLDNWLFGSGEGSRGVFTLVVGGLSLFAALVKLMLALSSLGKRQGERSIGVKRVEVGLAGFLTITTLLAFFALMSAKSAADAATAPTQALTSALESCTSQLNQRQPSLPAGAAPDQSLAKALDDIRASCVSNAANQAAELRAIKQIAVDVADDQQGVLFNLLLVLGAMGVFALLWKAFLGR